MGKSIIYFKRWTNKRYASFASMKAEVRICVLSLGCSLLTLPGAATYAQVDSTRNIRLTEVEVTAQKQQLHADLARVVTVMTKEEIATAPAATVAELLRFLSGVDIRQRGVNGVQSDVSMRGGSFDQMLVLLNGINVSDPQTGHYSLDIPVDISSIDRIEILQGPASRTLGPNAFSGAINIITGTSDTSSATLSYTGGDHGLTAPSASGTLALDKAKLFGAVSYNRSDGYTANTDYDILNAFGQVRVNTTATGDMNFQAGFQNKGYGALRIRQELYQRGVPKDTAAQQLRNMEPNWEKMHALLEKKLRGDVSDRKEREKAMAALQRRGFTFSEIKIAMDNYRAELQQQQEEEEFYVD